MLRLIVKGKLSGVDPGHTSIGDEAFANKTPLTFPEAIIAEEDSFVGEITIEQFEDIIGGPLSEVVEGNKVMLVLKQVPLLRNLPSTVLTMISGSISLSRFRSGDYIVEEGKEGSEFFIIKEG